jgi:hypothetical protein
MRRRACVAPYQPAEERRGLAPLAPTPFPLVATLGLEMGILGEEPQDMEWTLRQPFNHFVSIRFLFVPLSVRDLSISLRNDRPLIGCLRRPEFDWVHSGSQNTQCDRGRL